MKRKPQKNGKSRNRIKGYNARTVLKPRAALNGKDISPRELDMATVQVMRLLGL